MLEQLEQLSFLPELQIDRAAREGIVRLAVAYCGSRSIKYRDASQGMCPENGFDCSGFVTFLLKTLDIPLDDSIRHCNEYFDRFGILVQSGQQRRGDLIFFSRNGFFPTHVGIMVNSEWFVHAPGKDNTVVCLERIQPTHINRQGPEVIYNQNPIGFKRITQGRSASANSRWQRWV